MKLCQFRNQRTEQNVFLINITLYLHLWMMTTQTGKRSSAFGFLVWHHFEEVVPNLVPEIYLYSFTNRSLSLFHLWINNIHRATEHTHHPWAVVSLLLLLHMGSSERLGALLNGTSAIDVDMRGKWSITYLAQFFLLVGDLTSHPSSPRPLPNKSLWGAEVNKPCAPIV